MPQAHTKHDPSSVSNAAIAEMLRGIGEFLAMQDVPFKPRAYEKAAQTIDGLEDEVAETYKKAGGGKEGLKALGEIPGVGASIAEKIEELITTGRVAYYEQLKKKTPVDLGELSRVEGLGPKSVKKLYQKLGVENLNDLEKAARDGKIAKLEGFGPKSEEKILKSIGFARQSGVGAGSSSGRSGGADGAAANAGSPRFLLGATMPAIRTIVARLETIPGAEKVTIAGSARRRKETIGDGDILAVAAGRGAAAEKTTAAIMKTFIETPGVVNVIAHGPTKSSIKLKSGLNVDLRVVPAESYGAALNYFTGSKDHNVALRKIAVAKGWTLNEYGLFKKPRGAGARASAKDAPKGRNIGKENLIAGRTEEEVYKAFGMHYIEPELRENTGELEAAQRSFRGDAHGGLPKLIGYDELQGDLQVQTDWTDGAESIEQMALKAADRGLSYIVITDHTKRLAMTHGLDEKRIVQQWAEIDRVNKKLRGKICVLKGSECDILKDGSLDLPDKILAQLDVCGVSVHSHFNLSRADQTARVRRAIENPNADIFFHPTGRIINRRPPIDLDMDEIIAVAKRTGTVMEVNSFPERADLKDEYIRRCVETGVRLAIDSDAHNSRHYLNLEYGIAQARRGWATRADVINAWPAEKMLGFLKDKKSPR